MTISDSKSISHYTVKLNLLSLEGGVSIMNEGKSE